MTTIDATIYNNPTINIAIIGCISSGKSTLMNSLFGETYSSMHIKRTTMSPQVYCTDKTISSNPVHAQRVRAQNDEINKKLYAEGKISSCQEVEYMVPSMPDIFSETVNGGLVEYRIYDIPGLNDGATKQTFYNYISNNFYKFDLIIYNIDINSGLNTTDEIDILNLIKTNIEKIKREHQREARLIVVCNKCDDLIKSDKPKSSLIDSVGSWIVGSGFKPKQAEKFEGLISVNEEIEEMYGQVRSIIDKHFGLKIPIIKYSASNTYVYRCVKIRGKHFRPEHLDPAYIDKMGRDNFGPTPWARKSGGKTLDQKWQLISAELSENLDESLVLSGFNNLKITISIVVGHMYIYDLMYSKINYHKKVEDFETRYNFIMKLNKQFNCNYGDKQLNEYATLFIDHLDKKYNPTQIINSSNYASMAEYYKHLVWLNSLQLLTHSYNKQIKNKIAEYKTNENNYGLLSIENGTKTYTDIKEIIKLCTETIRISGPERIERSIIIKGLIKIIKIQDANEFIWFLCKSKVDQSILIGMWMNIIVNNINVNPTITVPIKNYIDKLYYTTSNEYFNYMSAHIFPVPQRIEYPCVALIDTINGYKPFINDFAQFILGSTPK
jgi:predicted GTPase